MKTIIAGSRDLAGTITWAGIAQLVEHRFRKSVVVGSKPTSGSTIIQADASRAQRFPVTCRTEFPKPPRP